MPTVDQSIVCTSCGTSIRGEDVLGVCSGCGTSIEQTLRRVGVDPVLMNVAEDVVCLRCGYNLRTIPISGVCPECGDAVVNSLRVDDLRGADRDWLRRVRSGVAFIIASTLIGIVTAVLSSMAPSTNNLDFWIHEIISVPVWVIFTIGIFKATGPDPSPTGQGFSPVYRKIAQVCALITGFLIPINWYVLGPTNFNPATALSGSTLLIMLLSIGISIISTFTCWGCLFICLRRIFHRARRIGLRRLASVQIAFIICVTIVGSIGFVLACVYSPSISSATNMANTPPAASAPLPGAKVTTPGPGIVIEDYAAAEEENSPDLATTRPTTSTAPGLIISSNSTVSLPGTSPNSTIAPGFILWLIFTLPFLICGGVLILLSIFIFGLIILIKSRRLLTDTLSASSGLTVT